MGALRSKPHSSISRNFAWPSASKRVSKFHGQHGRNPDIHEIAIFFHQKGHQTSFLESKPI